MWSKKSLLYLLSLTMFLTFSLISCGGGGGGGSSEPVYVRAAMITSSAGPWGKITIYRDGMDKVFGVGNWDELNIDTEDGSAFAADSPYDFIYLDGSDNGESALVAYMAAHTMEIETWINNGGRLYINAATQNTDVNAPFGVLIENVDDDPSIDFDSVVAVNSAHSIFNGPFTTAGTAFLGYAFAHNRIVGTGLANIIVSELDDSQICLASATHGSGFIVYGGITSNYYHDPQPNAHNLYMNILAWAAGGLTRANVALFINNDYVDYSNDGGLASEAYNLEQGIEGMGLPLSTFTGITASAFSAGRKYTLIIPELEAGDLDADLDSAARTAIADFVNAGGNLVVFLPDTYLFYLLNSTFGWSLSYGDYSGTLTLNSTDAEDTPFEFGPATLPYNDATSTVLYSSLPGGALAIYTDDSSGDAGLVVIPYGNGYVIILGWDWFDAHPEGSEDGGWLEVLETAINYYLREN